MMQHCHQVRVVPTDLHKHPRDAVSDVLEARYVDKVGVGQQL
jgi:hypothetical protein